MVVDKDVCERWWVTRFRLCVKDGDWQSCACERWCVKDGVWQMVCDKVVCHRWCATKLCVKDGVTKMVGPSAPPEPAQCHKCHACHAKRRRMSPSATPATWNEGGCHQVPRLPRETKVDVTECHACHAKWRCAPGDQRRPSAPPSATSATLATPNASRCLQAQRLPREMKVDVTKRHACHAKWRGAPGDQRRPNAPLGAISATPATWNEGGCHQVPRLPRKTKVHVSKCHACHLKRRWMSPSATPATQSGAAPRATNGDQTRHQVQQVPHLPRKTKVYISKCHACHVKRRWMSPSTTPATQNEGGCLQVPRLPRGTKVDVTKCHACHAKWRGAPGDQRRPNAPPSATSATPTTPNEGRCLQVPRLPRETKVDVTECHACHAKWRCAPGDQRRPSAPPSATSATPATPNNKDVCERW